MNLSPREVRPNQREDLGACEQLAPTPSSTNRVILSARESTAEGIAVPGDGAALLPALPAPTPPASRPTVDVELPAHVGDREKQAQKCERSLRSKPERHAPATSSAPSGVCGRSLGKRGRFARPGGYGGRADPVDQERPTNPGPPHESSPEVATIVALIGSLTLLVSGLAAYVVLSRLSAQSAAGPVDAPYRNHFMAFAISHASRPTSCTSRKRSHLHTDKQSSLFGLIATTDAILLVAAGDVTIGIDLAKLDEEDFVVDWTTGAARLTLPAPEILSTRLDEEHTYVYRRTTDLLAHRNEHLETKARQEALRAIGDAVRDPVTMEKARKQAERQVQQLLENSG